VNGNDLAALDHLILSRAGAVVSMLEIHSGATSEDTVGLRHDVDDNPGSLDTAVALARWEHARGYRSTYFILHTASYWQRDDLRHSLDLIAANGHEIDIHANAIPAALAVGGDPAEILMAAIEQLREWRHPVVGVAPHGDQLCYDAAARIRFVNDEIFTECARPDMGAPDRTITHGHASVTLRPLPLAAFGLEYETYRLPHGRYLSDSGGHWNIPLAEASTGDGQLHILQHPDWWSKAFPKEAP
jgi:hypothetical protein